MLIAGRTAGSTHVVSCCSGAWPADPLPRLGKPDEGFDLVAGGACVRGAEHAPVAAGADRADRPRRRVNGPREMANNALSIGGLIAGLAEIGTAVLAACGDWAFLSAVPARPDGRLVAAFAVVVAVDDRGDVVDATAACAVSLGSGAVTAQSGAVACSGAGCS